MAKAKVVKKDTPLGRGRPRIEYDKEKGDHILEGLLVGDKQLPVLCREVGIGKGTFYAWVHENPDFLDALKETQRKQCTRYLLEMDDLADNCDVDSRQGVAKAKLQIGLRQYKVSKIVGGIWADKPVEQATTSAVDTLAAAAKILEALKERE
jgi:hypothetical protein